MQPESGQSDEDPSLPPPFQSSVVGMVSDLRDQTMSRKTGQAAATFFALRTDALALNAYLSAFLPARESLWSAAGANIK